ncbi:MAG: HypC/HybG/HupF family hydrogenase formation chaperone [Methanobacteriota archaeon]|nr:MAG: HypC/HybG/HupF family hydrogenase formation chaperone [Euryarchaeota archaeon]
MCLAIPAKIVSIEGETGVVDFGGVKQKVRLDLLPDVSVGDHVLVHVGFAIEKIDKEEANKILELLDEISKTSSSGEV